MEKCFCRSARRTKKGNQPRQVGSRRIVIAFKGKAMRPGAYQQTLDVKAHYREQLDIEADKTRWWLQEQNLWNDDVFVIKIDVPVQSTGQINTIATFPIFDDPGAQDKDLTALFLLGFDARIYFLTKNEAKIFDPDKEDVATENKYLVKRLRRMRGE